MPSSPTANKIKICSNALLLLGAKPINSFIDGTDRSTLCANLYPIVKDEILSIYDWKFTIKKKQLNQKAESPITAWDNEFQLPANRLADGVIALYEDDDTGNFPFKDFDLQGDGILTNAVTLFMDYQANNVDEAVWPPYFVSLVVRAMQADLAMPITDKANLRDSIKIEVFGSPLEAGRGGLVRRAISRNSQGDAPQVFKDYSLIQARAEGS